MLKSSQWPNLSCKLLSVALLGSWHLPALAETAPSLAEVQIKSTAEDNPDSIETAGSRVEISGQVLKDSGVYSLAEASTRIPGFYNFGTTPRLTGFSIRGLGNNQFNDGLDSSVGLYVDGVYLARQSYAAFGLFDLDRLTVLRGPQGARYGLGTTAGEVQISTRQPSHTETSNISLSAGNFGYLQTEAATNISLIPGELAGRVSIYKQSRDGLLFNQFDGSQINDQNRLGLRGQLVWTPADDLLVRVVGEYGEIDQNCCAIALLRPVSENVRASDEYMGYDRPGTNPFERVTDNNVKPLGMLTREAVSLIAELGPIGRHRFVSITGVNQIGLGPARNDDGTSLNLVEGNITSRSRQFTQELRWHSAFKRLDTTVGAFFKHQNLRGNEVATLGDEIALFALGGVLRRQAPFLNRTNSGFLINGLLPPEGLDGLRLETPYSQRSNTYSIFVNGDWRTSVASTISTGLRFTESRREGSVSRSRSGGNLGASPLSFTNSLTLLGNLTGQDLSAVTYDGLIDALVGESFDRSDSRKDRGLSGQLAWHQQLSSTLSGHVSLSRGFKSGGLNLTGLSERVSAQFKPETADSIEIGLRRKGERTQISTALNVYNTRVRNFQALTYDEGTGLVPNPRQNNVLNIPKVSLQGLEVELGIPVSNSLAMGAGLAYNRARSTDFKNAPNEDTNRNDKDLSGKQLYNAPRWSGYAALEKKFARLGDLQPYLGVEHTFRSETFAAVDQSRSSFIDAYQLTNLRIGVRNLRQKWNLQAWAKNVFDEDYVAAVSALYSLGDSGGFAGDPLTYGLSLDMQFGP